MATLKEMRENVDNWIASKGEDCACAYALWLPMDVVDRAEERGMVFINDEQVANALHNIHRRQSAEGGITWDSIDAELDFMI